MWHCVDLKSAECQARGHKTHVGMLCNLPCDNTTMAAVVNCEYAALVW